VKHHQGPRLVRGILEVYAVLAKPSHKEADFKAKIVKIINN